MCAKFGCGPTVVSKKKVGTDKQRKLQLYIVCVCVCVCVCACVRACVLPSVYTSPYLWSDLDQIWHTHADSSRKGSGLNKNKPRVTQGGLEGQKFKNLE